jgi:hypothetical protein
MLALLVWGPMLPARAATAAADCALSCPGVMGPAGPIGCLDFTTTTGFGDCGEIHNGADGTGPLLRNLHCGGLNLGGGGSTEIEQAMPDGATTRFCIEACNGDTCTLGPLTASGPTFDCSAPGCSFGPPVAVGNHAVSTCVVRTWHGTAGGTVDVATGSISLFGQLDSQTYLTGNTLHPCPLCKQGAGTESDPPCAGSPDHPCAGVCELPKPTGVNLGGPNEGLPCISTNSNGLSKDCPPGGADAANDKPCDPDVISDQQCIYGTNLGSIPIALQPLTTGTSTVSDPDGFFCPHQDPNDQEPGQLNAFPGCFGTTPSADQTDLCRTITVRGSPAGPLLPPGRVKHLTLAAIFCIPRIGKILLDLPYALPGPGAVALPGDGVLLASDVPIPTTTTTATTTTVPTTTTTTLPSACVDAASFDSLLCRVDLLAAVVSQGGVARPIARALLRLAGKAHRQVVGAEVRAARGDVRGARRKLGAARRKLRVLGHRMRSRAGRRGIPAPLRDRLADIAAAIRADVRALAGSL